MKEQCGACGTYNAADSDYCQECGIKLATNGELNSDYVRIYNNPDGTAEMQRYRMDPNYIPIISDGANSPEITPIIPESEAIKKVEDKLDKLMEALALKEGVKNLDDLKDEAAKLSVADQLQRLGANVQMIDGKPVVYFPENEKTKEYTEKYAEGAEDFSIEDRIHMLNRGIYEQKDAWLQSHISEGGGASGGEGKINTITDLMEQFYPTLKKNVTTSTTGIYQSVHGKEMMDVMTQETPMFGMIPKVGDIEHDKIERTYPYWVIPTISSIFWVVLVGLIIN